MKAFFLPLLASALTLVAPAFADEMPNWYGTITFERTLDKTKTENFDKPNDPYYPGQRITTDNSHWSGTLRYLPGKRRVMGGTYTHEYHADRKSGGTRQCVPPTREGAWHDNESQAVSESASGSQEGDGQLSIYIGDDGSYQIGTGFGLPTQMTGGVHTNTRDIYDSCAPANSSHKVDSAKMFVMTPPFPTIVTGNVGTLPPETLSGDADPDLKDGSVTHVHWELTRTVPKVVARIHGPTTFKRADLVTLDGSASTGDIKEYRWHFVFHTDCTAAPATPDPEMVGVKISFHALCSFRAILSVKDSEGNINNDRHELVVQARDGDPWTLHYHSKAGPAITSRMTAEGMQIGINQCALHTDDRVTGHKIHTNADNNKTWLEDGYTIASVDDGGPFSGMWYVASSKLEINRLERTNADLKPASGSSGSGNVYALNLSKGNLAAVNALSAQVKDHEATHSTLMKEALDRLGTDGDPAHQIEKTLASSESLLQTLADMKVREVESILYDATSEANVKARLQSKSQYSKPVSIWLPKSTSDSTPTFYNMGPLWAIGDE